MAALVMLPRLASPQFGLLDDGLTLQTGREVHGRWASVLYLIPETGRFFPAYWLVYSVIWSLVGARPLAFFTVNVLLFAGLIAILARLVRLSGGTPASATVAAVLFALSGPAIETFYTLSKAEPLQATWIGISLLATAVSAREAQWSAGRAGWLTLAVTAAVLAHATKETSVVLIPIALGWLAIEWRARPRHDRGMRFAATYVAVTALSTAAFVALRWQYAALPLGEGTYTRAYALQSVGPALFRIVAWLLRDFTWLLPVLAAALVLVVRTAGAGRRPILYACIWMVAWLLVYLPWPATFEYYLLPFALGAAGLGGTVVGEAWALRTRQAWSLLVTTALLWWVTLVNVSVDARVQLAVDRANADLVDFLGTLPRDSHVVLNMTPPNEYHFELPMHLAEIKRRRDIVLLEPLEPLQPQESPGTFVVTPEMANQPGPTVRIALHEAGVRQDNATLRTIVHDGEEPVYRTAQRIGLLELGLQRLLCPLGVGPIFDPAYCPRDRGVIFRRTFAYGWQVHRVVRRTANAATMSHGG